MTKSIQDKMPNTPDLNRERLAGEGLRSTEQLFIYPAAGGAWTAIVSFGFA